MRFTTFNGNACKLQLYFVEIFSNITFILRKTSMKTQLAMRISDGFVLQFANFTLNAVEPTQGQICALPS